jgi:Uma2 family endonuclease
MSEPAEQGRITAETLYDLPDDGHRYELAAGRLVRMPPAGARHGSIAARIARLLDEYVEDQDLGCVCTADTGFILQRDPDIVRAPDVGFVAKARLAGGGEPERFWPFAPDLAIEVVSPSDRADELREKIRDYFAAGTRLVWVVYPGTRSVEVHRSMREARGLGEDDQLDGGDVLPCFYCPVRRCFD